jgi:hypothetical protein
MPQDRALADRSIQSRGERAALAIVSIAMAIRVLGSGLALDAHGVTGRGILVTRRLRWDDVARFHAGVEELAPNKPAAVVHARLRSGRVLTLPGSRVEGWTWTSTATARSPPASPRRSSSDARLAVPAVSRTGPAARRD